MDSCLTIDWRNTRLVRGITYVRPLSKIIKQTHQIALGMPAHQWPQGHITEFNRLSTDIGQMADAILERGNQLEELNTGLEARVNERTQSAVSGKEAR